MTSLNNRTTNFNCSSKAERTVQCQSHWSSTIWNVPSKAIHIQAYVFTNYANYEKTFSTLTDRIKTLLKKVTREDLSTTTCILLIQFRFYLFSAYETCEFYVADRNLAVLQSSRW